MSTTVTLTEAEAREMVRTLLAAVHAASERITELEEMIINRPAPAAEVTFFRDYTVEEARHMNDAATTLLRAMDVLRRNRAKRLADDCQLAADKLRTITRKNKETDT